ncbi:unnamed protein product [Trichobilharzia szidati]|nr:unnamed protein product [Trichobilharzia szidati]
MDLSTLTAASVMGNKKDEFHGNNNNRKLYSSPKIKNQHYYNQTIEVIPNTNYTATPDNNNCYVNELNQQVTRFKGHFVLNRKISEQTNAGKLFRRHGNSLCHTNIRNLHQKYKTDNRNPSHRYRIRLEYDYDPNLDVISSKEQNVTMINKNGMAYSSCTEVILNELQPVLKSLVKNLVRKHEVKSNFKNVEPKLPIYSFSCQNDDNTIKSIDNHIRRTEYGCPAFSCLSNYRSHAANTMLLGDENKLGQDISCVQYPKHFEDIISRTLINSYSNFSVGNSNVHFKSNHLNKTSGLLYYNCNDEDDCNINCYQDDFCYNVFYLNNTKMIRDCALVTLGHYDRNMYIKYKSQSYLFICCVAYHQPSENIYNKENSYKHINCSFLHLYESINIRQNSIEYVVIDKLSDFSCQISESELNNDNDTAEEACCSYAFTPSNHVYIGGDSLNIRGECNIHPFGICCSTCKDCLNENVSKIFSNKESKKLSLPLFIIESMNCARHNRIDEPHFIIQPMKNDVNNFPSNKQHYNKYSLLHPDRSVHEQQIRNISPQFTSFPKEDGDVHSANDMRIHLVLNSSACQCQKPSKLTRHCENEEKFCSGYLVPTETKGKSLLCCPTGNYSSLSKQMALIIHLDSRRGKCKSRRFSSIENSVNLSTNCLRLHSLSRKKYVIKSQTAKIQRNLVLSTLGQLNQQRKSNFWYFHPKFRFDKSFSSKFGNPITVENFLKLNNKSKYVFINPTDIPQCTECKTSNRHRRNNAASMTSCKLFKSSTRETLLNLDKQISVSRTIKNSLLHHYDMNNKAAGNIENDRNTYLSRNLREIKCYGIYLLEEKICNEQYENFVNEYQYIEGYPTTSIFYSVDFCPMCPEQLSYISPINISCSQTEIIKISRNDASRTSDSHPVYRVLRLENKNLDDTLQKLRSSVQNSASTKYLLIPIMPEYVTSRNSSTSPTSTLISSPTTVNDDDDNDETDCNSHCDNLSNDCSPPNIRSMQRSNSNTAVVTWSENECVNNKNPYENFGTDDLLPTANWTSYTSIWNSTTGSVSETEIINNNPIYSFSNITTNNTKITTSDIFKQDNDGERELNFIAVNPSTCTDIFIISKSPTIINESSSVDLEEFLNFSCTMSNTDDTNYTTESANSDDSDGPQLNTIKEEVAKWDVDKKKLKYKSVKNHLYNNNDNNNGLESSAGKADDEEQDVDDVDFCITTSQIHEKLIIHPTDCYTNKTDFTQSNQSASMQSAIRPLRKNYSSQSSVTSNNILHRLSHMNTNNSNIYDSSAKSRDGLFIVKSVNHLTCHSNRRKKLQFKINYKKPEMSDRVQSFDLKSYCYYGNVTNSIDSFENLTEMNNNSLFNLEEVSDLNTLNCELEENGDEAVDDKVESSVITMNNNMVEYTDELSNDILLKRRERRIQVILSGDTEQNQAESFKNASSCGSKSEDYFAVKKETFTDTESESCSSLNLTLSNRQNDGTNKIKQDLLNERICKSVPKTTFHYTIIRLNYFPIHMIVHLIKGETNISCKKFIPVVDGTKKWFLQIIHPSLTYLNETIHQPTSVNFVLTLCQNVCHYHSLHQIQCSLERKILNDVRAIQCQEVVTYQSYKYSKTSSERLQIHLKYYPHILSALCNNLMNLTEKYTRFKYSNKMNKFYNSSHILVKSNNQSLVCINIHSMTENKVYCHCLKLVNQSTEQLNFVNFSLETDILVSLNKQITGLFNIHRVVPPVIHRSTVKVFKKNFTSVFNGLFGRFKPSVLWNSCSYKPVILHQSNHTSCLFNKQYDFLLNPVDFFTDITQRVDSSSKSAQLKHNFLKESTTLTSKISAKGIISHKNTREILHRSLKRAPIYKMKCNKVNALKFSMRDKPEQLACLFKHPASTCSDPSERYPDTFRCECLWRKYKAMKVGEF